MADCPSRSRSTGSTRSAQREQAGPQHVQQRVVAARLTCKFATCSVCEQPRPVRNLPYTPATVCPVQSAVRRRISARSHARATTRADGTRRRAAGVRSHAARLVRGPSRLRRTSPHSVAARSHALPPSWALLQGGLEEAYRPRQDRGELRSCYLHPAPLSREPRPDRCPPGVTGHQAVFAHLGDQEVHPRRRAQVGR